MLYFEEGCIFFFKFTISIDKQTYTVSKWLQKLSKGQFANYHNRERTLVYTQTIHDVYTYVIPSIVSL